MIRAFSNLAVSEESLSIGDLTQSITQFKTKIASDFIERYRYYTGIVNRKPDPSQLGFSNLPSLSKFNRLISRYSYAELREVAIAVPAGMVSTYDAYLTVMEAAVSVSADLEPKRLAPFNHFLGELLNDAERASDRVRGYTLNAAKAPNIDQLFKHLSTCFELGNNRTQVPFGTVFKNNGELTQCVRRAGPLVTAMDQKPRQKTLQAVDTLDQYLDFLIEGINDGTYQLTQLLVDTLTLEVSALSREVEFYGIISYHLQGLVAALYYTAETLSYVKRGPGVEEAEAPASEIPEEYTHLFHQALQALQDFFKIEFKASLRMGVLTTCIKHNNTPDETQPFTECAGAWTQQGIIYIGTPHHLQQVQRVHQAQSPETYVLKPLMAFAYSVFVHELAHEVYRHHLNADDRAEYAALIGTLKTPYTELYKRYESADDLQEEYFCEWVVKQLT